MGNKKLSPRDKNRIDLFLRSFSEERSDIRAEIASILPVFNSLLDMHALSFEEFALQIEAEKRGVNFKDPLFSYNSIMPSCPKCQTYHHTRKVSSNMYVCSTCKTKFAANHNSISTGTKCSSIVWLKVLHSILNFSSMDETCKTCGISPNTYYNIRNKLFYAMQLMMEQVQLYGVVACDITFVRASYKGLDLSDPNYPEESIFNENDYNPRESRKRGKRNPIDERSVNSISIFTAIDDSKHVMAKYIGLGAATASRLRHQIGENRLLHVVPEAKPAPWERKKNIQPELHPGEDSLLVSDAENAIIKFATEYGISHEYHVYRRNAVQVKLPEGAHDIQAVNQLHSKLKRFLRNTNYVSSKYLPGFLVLFEFIENTQGSQEAISQLFRILSQPGLGQSAEFYDSLYVILNYLQQWLSDDNPLKHLKKNQIKAYYLYRKRMEDIKAGVSAPQQVSEIADMCNMSASSVRRNYKNLENTGYGPIIMEVYNPRKANRKQVVRKSFSPEILSLYDEFCRYQRQGSKRIFSLSSFLREKSSNDGVIYQYCNISYYFREIERHNIRGKT